MKLLVLAVDRDDDLGRKTRLSGPLIGRDAVLEGAQSLAIADPEESDANAMFAAVSEYDKIHENPGDYNAADVEVACVTGNIRVGSKSDSEVAKQFEEVLVRVGDVEVILVSDGAEDEHLLPILSSRAPIAGMRRVVIKQAKNIEGFLYLMVRLMHDEKMQRRFFLPLAFLLFAAAVSVLLNQWGIFISFALALAGFMILIQVFGWEDSIERFFAGLAQEARAGKTSLMASFASLALVVIGGYLTLRSPEVQAAASNLEYGIVFASGVFWWIVGAVLVALGGRAVDTWVQRNQVPAGYVEAGLFFLSGAVLVWAGILGAEAWHQRTELLNYPWLLISTYVFFAGFLFFAGLIAVRYFQTLPAAARHREGRTTD